MSCIHDYRRRRFGYWRLALQVVLALTAVGCRKNESSDAAPDTAGREAEAARIELTLSVAASLSDVSRELAEAFAVEHPRAEFQFNLGASDALAAQIEQGAPADVFLSADPRMVDRLAESQAVLADSRTPFAGNTLVLIVPIAAWPAGLDARGFGAAADERIGRLALGSPQVPAGRYAEEALRAAGVWDSLQGRIVPGENARQVLDYAIRGEVDAGIVYGTDALKAGGAHRVIASLPVPGRNYVAAVTAASDAAETARGFVAFLTSNEARAILTRHGFVVD